MIVIKLLFSFFFVLTIGTACSQEETQLTVTGEIDAQEVLSLDSEAEIFQYNGIIYQMNSERIDEKGLSPLEELFKISNQTDNPEGFSNRTANVLPVGTPIYSSSENNVLLADVDGQILSYHAIIEG